MGLRTKNGVGLDKILKKYPNIVKKWISKGLATINGGNRLSLTHAGWLISDTLFTEII